MASGFELPPYPFDRLTELRAVADALPGGCVDLSAGTPTDPPPDLVKDALARASTLRGYPPSVGTPELREAAAGWLGRRFGAAVEPAQVAACVGTKELVAGLPQWLRLRSPDRDTVLYPHISYPTYAMGATLAGCRAVGYADLAEIAPEDVERALCLWVNSPANPTGELTDLAAAAAWGRAHQVPVLSDECYIELTWDGPGRTILEHGTDGVIAMHSLSKRSNLAGLRVGFYAGDAELVHYLSELRKHAGFMAPGPAQEAAVAALQDDAHVDAQLERYVKRLSMMAGVLRAAGVDCREPAGTFYLWCRSADATEGGWQLARRLAEQAGMLVAPGDFYGAAGQDHIRVALVRPDDQIELVAQRLAAVAPPGRAE